MLHLGLYLDNHRTPEADFSRPDLGNPGVGGTQYGITALAWHLTRLHPEEVRCTLFARTAARLPAGIDAVEVSSVGEALAEAQRRGVDVFLTRHTDEDLQEGVLPQLQTARMPILLWAQNYVSRPWQTAILSTAQIARVVCVGQEQFDVMRDRPVINRCVRIFNAIDPGLYRPPEDQQKEPGLVVYLGALVPYKGFHVLAEAWPEIRRRIPHARLQVVGSGRLYDRASTLGPWGVAEEPYESRLRAALADGSSRRDLPGRPDVSCHFGLPGRPDLSVGPDSSVSFLGNLGPEKIDLLRRAEVGVVNPTGRGETYCWSAVEFQASGTPVVAAREGGLLDTVRHRATGLLVPAGRPRAVARAVIRLLTDAARRERMAGKALRWVETFSYERICPEWIALFREVLRGDPVVVPPIRQFPFYRKKWLREGVRKVRRSGGPGVRRKV